jgi:hypothetical protein
MNSYIFDFIRDHLLTQPDLAKFALGLILIITVPRLCRLARMPRTAQRTASSPSPHAAFGYGNFGAVGEIGVDN